VRQKLEARGFDSYVIPGSHGGDGKWRVRVGPVPSREGADALAARLKSEEKLPTWVLPEGGS
jgi:cell division septation protein DedD